LDIEGSNDKRPRDRGRPRKQWQRVDAGTGKATLTMEEDDDEELIVHQVGFIYKMKQPY
jgi:hypothetical protein